LRDELAKHLSHLKRQRVISAWHDRMIGAGEEWKGEIDKNLEEAQVILLLISASFMASDYCHDIEMKRAMERHDAGTARVIPVILRSVDWRNSPFARLQVLPKDGKPVTLWSDRDEAFTDVAKGIRQAVEEMTAPSVSPSPGFGGEEGAGERDSSLSAATGVMDDPGNHIRRRALERIESLLKRLKAAVLRDLAKELFDQDNRAIEEGTGPIVAHLTTPPKPTPDTIGALAEIHESLCRKSADWEQAGIVAEIIEEATPLAIDDGLARRVRNDIHNRNSAFFFVPDHYSTTLEVLMACADGKPTKYRTPEVETEDYEGKPLIRRAGKLKLPVEAPPTAESVAKSILVDLCEGQAVYDSAGQSRTLKALVQRLLGVLNRYRHGENRGRTLYCFHALPDDQKEHTFHKDALTLIRKELDALRPKDPELLKEFPRFVFLLLEKTSVHEELRSVIVTVLLTRFKHERTRPGHAASQ